MRKIVAIILLIAMVFIPQQAFAAAPKSITSNGDGDTGVDSVFRQVATQHRTEAWNVTKNPNNWSYGEEYPWILIKNGDETLVMAGETYGDASAHRDILTFRYSHNMSSGASLDVICYLPVDRQNDYTYSTGAAYASNLASNQIFFHVFEYGSNGDTLSGSIAVDDKSFDTAKDMTFNITSYMGLSEAAAQSLCRANIVMAIGEWEEQILNSYMAIDDFSYLGLPSQCLGHDYELMNIDGVEYWVCQCGDVKQKGETLVDVTVDEIAYQKEAYNALADVNNLREQNGLAPLKWDGDLEAQLVSRAAKLHGKWDLSVLPDGTSDYWPSGVSVFAFGSYGGDTWESLTEYSLSEYASTYLKTNAKGIAFAFVENAEGGILQVYLAAVTTNEPTNTGKIGKKYKFTDSFKLLEAYCAPNWFCSCSATDFYENGDNFVVKGREDLQLQMFANDYVRLKKVKVYYSDDAIATYKQSSGLLIGKKVGFTNVAFCLSEFSDSFLEFTLIVKPKGVMNPKISALKKGAKITWTKEPGAAGYKVYRSTKKSSGYKCVKTINNWKTTKFTDKKLKSKKTYYYKIKGFMKYDDRTILGTFSKVLKVTTK